jgi:hypothetical protein
MNDDDLNQLESRLRSWRPRRPSTTFKLRLALATGNFFPRAARFAGVLVPAAACVLLAMLNSNSQGEFPSHAPLFSVSVSNQNYAAYWVEAGEKGENCPPGQIFKWTNAGTSTSSMRFK